MNAIINFGGKKEKKEPKPVHTCVPRIPRAWDDPRGPLSYLACDVCDPIVAQLFDGAMLVVALAGTWGDEDHTLIKWPQWMADHTCRVDSIVIRIRSFGGVHRTEWNRPVYLTTGDSLSMSDTRLEISIT